MAFQGTLSIAFAAMPSVSIHDEGFTSIGVSGPRLVHWFAAGEMAGQAKTPVAIPVVPSGGTVAISLDAALGAGPIGPFFPKQPLGLPQLESRELPLGGEARLCLFFESCALPMVLSLSQAGGAFGEGGVLTLGGYGASRISMDAAPWTLGSASITIETPSGSNLTLFSGGFVHGPASFTQSTAITGGEFSLVTPLQVTSRVGQQWNAFGRLRIRFVPEPGRLVSISAGGALLWLLGRRRKGLRRELPGL